MFRAYGSYFYVLFLSNGLKSVVTKFSMLRIFFFRRAVGSVHIYSNIFTP